MSVHANAGRSIAGFADINSARSGTAEATKAEVSAARQPTGETTARKDARAAVADAASRYRTLVGTLAGRQRLAEALTGRDFATLDVRARLDVLKQLKPLFDALAAGAITPRVVVAGASGDDALPSAAKGGFAKVGPDGTILLASGLSSADLAEAAAHEFGEAIGARAQSLLAGKSTQVALGEIGGRLHRTLRTGPATDRAKTWLDADLYGNGALAHDEAIATLHGRSVEVQLLAGAPPGVKTRIVPANSGSYRVYFDGARPQGVLSYYDCMDGAKRGPIRWNEWDVYINNPRGGQGAILTYNRRPNRLPANIKVVGRQRLPDGFTTFFLFDGVPRAQAKLTLKFGTPASVSIGGYKITGYIAKGDLPPTYDYFNPTGGNRARLVATRTLRALKRLSAPARLKYSPIKIEVSSTGFITPGGAYVRASVPSELVSIELENERSPIWTALLANSDAKALAGIKPRILQPNYLPLTKTGLDIVKKGGTREDIQAMLVASGVTNGDLQMQITQDVLSMLGVSNSQAKAVMDRLMHVVRTDSQNGNRNNSLQDILNKMMNLRARLDPAFTATSVALSVASGTKTGNMNDTGLQDFFMALLQGSPAGSITRAAVVGAEYWRNAFGEKWIEVWGRGVLDWSNINRRVGRWNHWVNAYGNYAAKTDARNLEKEAGTVGATTITAAMPTESEVKQGYGVSATYRSPNSNRVAITTQGLSLTTVNGLSQAQIKTINGKYILDVGRAMHYLDLNSQEVASCH